MPAGICGKYLSLSSFVLLEGGVGIVAAGRLGDDEDDLALDVEILEIVEGDRLFLDAVADEDDGRGHGLAGREHARVVDAGQERMRLDGVPLVDLERHLARGLRGLLEGEVLEIRLLGRGGGLGRGAPHHPAAEAAAREVAGGLELPQGEERGRVIGGQLVAPGAGLAAFQEVGREVAQHGDRILGRDGLEAGFHDVGDGLGFLDKNEVLGEVLGLGLGLRRDLGADGERQDHGEQDSQDGLFHTVFLLIKLSSLDAGLRIFFPMLPIFRLR